MSRYSTEGACTACKIDGELDIHHIKSRGAGGTENPNNLMPLCRRCHQEYHRIGRNGFVSKHNLNDWMVEHNWLFDKFMGKWIFLTSKGWDDDGN